MFLDVSTYSFFNQICFQVPGMCRVTCAHCHDSFLFNTLNNALARYYLDKYASKVLDNAYSNLHKLSIDDAFIQKAHKLGIEAAYPALFAMDYK